MKLIAENYQRIRKEIPDNVTIVLASKTRTPKEVIKVIETGATDIGENYVQKAEKMYNCLGVKAKKSKMAYDWSITKKQDKENMKIERAWYNAVKLSQKGE